MNRLSTPFQKNFIKIIYGIMVLGYFVFKLKSPSNTVTKVQVAKSELFKGRKCSNRNHPRTHIYYNTYSKAH